MTQQLITTSIAAPGFYGLNTQASEVTLSSGFARNAENCVIDEGGRLGARKGWTYISEPTSGTPNLKGLHRFVDVAGIDYFGCWSDTDFYIQNGSTLDPVTYSGSQVITEGNWQAVSLYDAAFLVQDGYEPLYFDPVAGDLDDISNHPDYSATAAGVPSANTALAAYSRLWIADTNTNKTTVYWSDALSGFKWNSGSAGSLDISSVLIHGNDEIVGLGAHNGYLIIFCKSNIVIFGDASANDNYVDPLNDLQLIEVISGVGCIARDSIQNVGSDIVFLSESGLRSLGRTIQEKSQPLNDISKNIRDTLIENVRLEDVTKIKSCYSEHNAFYLLALPTTQTVYCFDARGLLEDGSARVTRWNGLNHTAWLAFETEVYMTNTDGLAQYFGYDDNGESYEFQYYTNYFNLEMPSQLKIVKNVAVTVIGSTGQQFVIKIGSDYQDLYTSYPLSLKEGATYEYNIAEYGLATTAASTQAADTVTVEGDPITISGATQANPCSITATGHGLSTGDEVRITDVVGMTELNDNVYTITVVDANTFTLDSTDSSAYTAYVSGGEAVHLDSYTVDFTTTYDASTYDTSYVVWEDADGYYYTIDNGSRTKTTLYTKSEDWFSEFSGASLIENIRLPVGGSGFVIQMGFESTIQGGFLNIQQIDLYLKQGRLY